MLAKTLFSNPHSHSPSSIATGERVNSARQLILDLFKADRDLFDVVFVANATAGIKLVAEGFNASAEEFRFTYLEDVHTSLIGITGLASCSGKCLSESEVDKWLKETDTGSGLFAYPAQSNFNGRRFPLEWITSLRESHPGWYTLLDAASFLTTTPLDYSDASRAPHFTVLSLYKIFGYPDLGVLIVKKEAGDILIQRHYFGGGTRNTLSADGKWRTPRDTLHEALEDGTLPFHTIAALEAALNNYRRLFGSHLNVSRHAAAVTRLAYKFLSSIRHLNGRPVCKLYSSLNNGPILAFNLTDPNGNLLGFSNFERFASLRGFALRTGGLCNPGGVQRSLEIPKEELAEIFESGKICDDDIDMIEGKVMGVIRISFGACSMVEDVYPFIRLILEFYETIEHTEIRLLQNRSSMTRSQLSCNGHVG